MNTAGKRLRMRGAQKNGEEFKCQIVNKKMTISLFKVIKTNKKYTSLVV